jgi:hypothetical protein
MLWLLLLALLLLLLLQQLVGSCRCLVHLCLLRHSVLLGLHPGSALALLMPWLPAVILLL